MNTWQTTSDMDQSNNTTLMLSPYLFKAIFETVPLQIGNQDTKSLEDKNQMGGKFLDSVPFN